MLFEEMFVAFRRESPLTVMARATVQLAFSPAELDAFFARTAERGHPK